MLCGYLHLLHTYHLYCYCPAAAPATVAITTTGAMSAPPKPPVAPTKTRQPHTMPLQTTRRDLGSPLYEDDEDITRRARQARTFPLTSVGSGGARYSDVYQPHASSPSTSQPGSHAAMRPRFASDHLVPPAHHHQEVRPPAGVSPFVLLPASPGVTKRLTTPVASVDLMSHKHDTVVLPSHTPTRSSDHVEATETNRLAPSGTAAASSTSRMEYVTAVCVSS